METYMAVVRILVTLVVTVLAFTQVGLGADAPAREKPREALQMWSLSRWQPESPDLWDVGTASGRGLQDGWAIDNSCGVMFTPEVAAVIAEAGAAWVRINFRLGAAQSWTETGTCNGVSALELYDAVVDNARAEGLQVLGLLSNESWPGTQAEWQANSAERNAGSSGDNGYLVAFSKNAALVLAQHFTGRVAGWEVWNEPNAYTSFSDATGYVGSTYIYPSNFAWLLRHVYEEADAAGVTGALFVSGGVFGHDLPSALTPSGAGVERKRGDPQTPGYSVPGGSKPALPLSADPIAMKSGADYLRATYTQGIALAGWGPFQATHGIYPLDGIGQHIYVDQGAATSAAKIAAYLAAVRAAALEHPEVPPPPTWITEIGWATSYVSQATQAANLRIAFAQFAATDYVTVPFWFQLRDIAGANLYYGLITPVDPPWTRKPSWDAFRPYRVFVPILWAVPEEPPG
jgi:hypothetical protein